MCGLSVPPSPELQAPELAWNGNDFRNEHEASECVWVCHSPCVCLLPFSCHRCTFAVIDTIPASLPPFCAFQEWRRVLVTCSRHHRASSPFKPVNQRGPGVPSALSSLDGGVGGGRAGGRTGTADAGPVSLRSQCSVTALTLVTRTFPLSLHLRRKTWLRGAWDTGSLVHRRQGSLA